MPKVKQLAPTWTEKESELVEKIISRELGRLGYGYDFEIVEPDPFEVRAPSVRRRLVDRLARAHDKLRTALGLPTPAFEMVPAIATTPEKETDIQTEIG